MSYDLDAMREELIERLSANDPPEPEAYDEGETRRPEPERQAYRRHRGKLR
jgi:hypothetical protein